MHQAAVQVDVADLQTVQFASHAPGHPAVVAGAGPPPAQARIIAGLSGDDRGTDMPHDDQAVRGEASRAFRMTPVPQRFSRA